MIKKILCNIYKKYKKYVWKKDALLFWSENHLLPEYNKKEYQVYEKKGFSASHYLLYNLKKNDYNDYLSCFDRKLMREINGEYKVILDDKRLFYKIFDNHIKHPLIMFSISKKQLYDNNNEKISSDALLNYLKENEGLFYTRTKSGGGLGAHLLEIKDNKFLRDGEEISSFDFSQYSDGYFTTIFKQSEFSKNIYPNSINTIRIVSINDDNVFSIPVAAFRFGTNISNTKDNLGSGGIAANIDVSSGKMSSAKSMYVPGEFKVHPNTFQPIEDVIVPKWKLIKNKVLELHKMVPFLKFIAWDIVLLDDDIGVIEGNASSSTNIIQIKEGQKNTKLGDFLKKNGVIFK